MGSLIGVLEGYSLYELCNIRLIQLVTTSTEDKAIDISNIK